MRNLMYFALVLAMVVQGCADIQEKQTQKYTEVKSASISEKRAEKRNIILVSRDVVEERIPTYNIPLDKEIQKYIYKEAERQGVSYELMLAIAYTESTFRHNVVSFDGSSVGLFQLNVHTTFDWLAAENGMKNADPLNPYHSAKLAIWYVRYLYDYYLQQGYDEGTVTKKVLLAYRYGISKSKNYGLSNRYVDKVLDYKMKLEKGELINV